MSHLSCGCKNKLSSYSVAVMVISNAIASASFPNSAQLYESGNLGKIPILPTTFFHLHFMDRPCCQPCWKLQNLLSCSNNGCTLFTLFTHSDPPIRSFHTKTLFKSNEKSGNGKRGIFYVRQSTRKKKACSRQGLGKHVIKF